jgi:hypothetical protein
MRSGDDGGGIALTVAMVLVAATSQRDGQPRTRALRTE